MPKKRATPPEHWRNAIVRYADEDPASLIANPGNWRTHPKEQTTALTGSLNEVGWIAPVIVNETTQHVVDGHARIGEAIARGEPTVPVAYVSLTEDQERLALATFDPISAMAGTDQQMLDDLLASVSAPNELADLVASLASEQPKQLNPDDADLTPPTEPITKPGDLWLLGEHRLLCGDSTSADDVARLMDGATPEMVFADPPYGIEIVDVKGWVGGPAAYDIPFGGRKGQRLGSTNASKPFGSKNMRGTVGASHVVEAGRYEPVIGDDTTETAVAASQLALGLWPGAVHVWWGGNYYANTLPPSSCWIVWDKDNTGNFADAELAWTNQETAVRMFSHRWNGMVKASEHGERRVHPTQKPVALAAWVYETYGRSGDLIFDPFLGSGMALIAAEQLDRRVFGCELSEAYCDVIVRRWENLTGGKAQQTHPGA